MLGTDLKKIDILLKVEVEQFFSRNGINPHKILCVGLAYR